MQLSLPFRFLTESNLSSSIFLLLLRLLFMSTSLHIFHSGLYSYYIWRMNAIAKCVIFIYVSFVCLPNLFKMWWLWCVYLCEFLPIIIIPGYVNYRNNSWKDIFQSGSFRYWFDLFFSFCFVKVSYSLFFT